MFAVWIAKEIRYWLGSRMARFGSSWRFLKFSSLIKESSSKAK